MKTKVKVLRHNTRDANSFCFWRSLKASKKLAIFWAVW